jgi:hypothetical protein
MSNGVGLAVLATGHASFAVALFPFDGAAAPKLLDGGDQRLLAAEFRLGRSGAGNLARTSLGRVRDSARPREGLGSAA